jgi:hypothetical protein
MKSEGGFEVDICRMSEGLSQTESVQVRTSKRRVWSGQIDPTCIRININVERSGRFPDGNPMQETIVPTSVSTSWHS